MSPKITVPNIKANTVRPREDASFGADYAPLNGRTETGICLLSVCHRQAGAGRADFNEHLNV